MFNAFSQLLFIHIYYSFPAAPLATVDTYFTVFCCTSIWAAFRVKFMLHIEK